LKKTQYQVRQFIPQILTKLSYLMSVLEISQNGLKHSKGYKYAGVLWGFGLGWCYIA
jgi:hypothetical protein